MTEQGCDARGIGREVETALGFALSSFKPIKGGSSLNFKAVRASDSFEFFVKLLDPRRAYLLPGISANAKVLARVGAAQLLFEDTVARARGCRLVFFEWCEGRQMMPYRLSGALLRAFAGDYLRLSEALQSVRFAVPEDPFAEWRAKILSMEGRFLGPLKRFVERELPEGEVVRRPELTKKIYGDFHHGNVLFRDGRVHRYLDLEAVGDGYPADDMVRYFACAMEHLPLGGLGRRRRMLAAFAEIVKSLPYSLHEWEAAVNAALLRKFDGREADEFGPATVANLLYRAGFYLDLKRVARSILQ